MAKREPTEEEAEDALIARDYVMARTGAAIAAIDGAKIGLLDALTLFVDPSSDRTGKKRREALDAAIETLGIATRSLEDAMDVIDDADFEAGEPWEEEDDDPESAS